MTDRLKPKPTAEIVRSLLIYDQDTGFFFWKINRRAGAKSKDKAGHLIKHSGYINIRINGKGYMAHRLAWLHVYGHWPELEIDHIDGVRTNNAMSNLRNVSRIVNCQNLRSAPTRNVNSGLLGVYPNGKKWRARITVLKKPISLGTFDFKEQAHAAYLSAKRIHHEGCVI